MKSSEIQQKQSEIKIFLKKVFKKLTVKFAFVMFKYASSYLADFSNQRLAILGFLFIPSQFFLIESKTLFGGFLKPILS